MSKKKRSFLRKIDYNAPYTLTFCLIAVIVHATGILTGGWLQESVFSLPGQSSFQAFMTYPRILLHVFGHASMHHLVFNLTIILLIGPMLEEMYGAGLLIGLTLITAILTGLVMIFFFEGLLLGASGVVFALIILSSFAKSKAGTLPLTFVFVTIIYLGGEIYRAFSVQDNIAQFAHIIGGVCGGFCGFVFARRAESPWH